MDEEVEFDLQDVIDTGEWGSEPGEGYKQSLDMLDNVVRECIWVSNRYAGVASPEGRYFYASVLFVALITRGVSLLHLAPHSPWAAKKIEHWDYASMTGIVRTMIELRAAFHYLCTDPCPDDEWDCRWNLFNLHDCVSRIRLFEAQGNDEEVAAFEIEAEKLREHLRANVYFQSIDPKRHKKLLHGQTAYLFPLETLMERAGMEIDTFRMLYVLFSTHVHALPMSFFRIGGGHPERGRGLPSPVEEGHSALCLALAAGLIVTSRDELHVLFEGLERDPAYVAEESLHASDDDADERVKVDDLELAIGESRFEDASEDIRIGYTRQSDAEILVTYVHRSSGDAVFEGTFSDVEGQQFDYIDPYFWEISLNGMVTTHAAMERMMEAEFLMRIDVDRRRIHFKTRVEGNGQPAER